MYRIDDAAGAVYGTVGYQAPEIADRGPSVESDLFTVARTLAVLCIEFKGYQGTFKFTLPPRATFRSSRGMTRSTGSSARQPPANPDDRFQSAAEMSDQLHGVLREVVAEQQAASPFPRRARCSPRTFVPDQTKADWRLLPRAAGCE